MFTTTTTYPDAKPFVKWVGGKGRILPALSSLLPADLHNLNGLTYIEPFAGGGAMLFYMLRTYPNICRALINDVNPNLIKAYLTVRNNPEELITLLHDKAVEYHNLPSENSRREYYLSLRQRFNTQSCTRTENSVMFLFLNRTCFNGLYRVNTENAFNVAFGRYNNPTKSDEENIRAASRLLQKVEIVTGDFEQAESYTGRNTFVYIDPPYRPISNSSGFTQYSPAGFDDREQIRLKHFIDRLSPHARIMASNSDCRGRNPDDTFLEELYAGYRIDRIQVPRSINANPHGRSKLSELVIRNY